MRGLSWCTPTRLHLHSPRSFHCWSEDALPACPASRHCPVGGFPSCCPHPWGTHVAPMQPLGHPAHAAGIPVMDTSWVHIRDQHAVNPAEQGARMLCCCIMWVARFVACMPYHICPALTLQFLPHAVFHNPTLRCLTEIGSLDIGEALSSLVTLVWHPLGTLGNQYPQRLVELFNQVCVCVCVCLLAPCRIASSRAFLSRCETSSVHMLFVFAPPLALRPTTPFYPLRCCSTYALRSCRSQTLRRTGKVAPPAALPQCLTPFPLFARCPAPVLLPGVYCIIYISQASPQRTTTALRTRRN